LVDRGWETQGLSTFSGTAVYALTVDLHPRAGQCWLYLPSLESTVEARWNRNSLGSRGWPPYLFRIPAGWIEPGPNSLELHVSNTAANQYWVNTAYQSSPQGSGLLAPPQLLWCEDMEEPIESFQGFNLESARPLTDT
jgi:hypothetical protein